MPKKRKNSDTNQKDDSSVFHFLMILSPAKSLDLTEMEKDVPIKWTTPSCDNDRTKEIAKIVKEHANNKPSKFLGLSASLSQVAVGYWDKFELTAPDTGRLKPCGFMFSGAAYQGLDMSSLVDNEDAIQYLQDHLRIVDPLYGWLRPMDAIQPYRLEMATSPKIVPVHDGKTKLAAFWKPAIAKSLLQDQQNNKLCVLNVASDEYSAAVPSDGFFVKVIFRHAGRVIAVHAKRVRGLLVRYMAQNDVTTMEEIQQFAMEGYTFQADSSNETTLIFDRSKDWHTTKQSADQPKKVAKRQRKSTSSRNTIF